MIKGGICELQLFCLKFRQVLNGSAAASDLSGQLEARLALVEKLLPWHPNWINGHLLRAMAIIERRYRFGAEPSSQDLSALRVSLKAVETLGGERAGEIISIWFGYAMAFFFERKMEEALRCFRDLAARDDLDVLDAWQVVAVFEGAASSSMALGEEAAARAFLEQIPPNERSPETAQLLNMLSQKS